MTTFYPFLVFAGLVLAALVGASLVKAVQSGASRPGRPALMVLAASLGPAVGPPLLLGLGLALGPAGFGVVGSELYEQLGPLLVLGLGYIGFLAGMHLEWHRLCMFPMRLHLFAQFQAAAVLGVVFLAFAPAVSPVAGFLPAGTAGWAAAGLLAASAAGTGPASVFILGTVRAVRGPHHDAIRFVSALDDIPGLLAMGLVFAFVHMYGVEHDLGFDGGHWLALIAALGVAFGVLLRFLVRPGTGEDDIGVLVLGVLGLLGGLSAYLHLPGLVIAVIAGATFVNMSSERERIYEVLAHREHAVYALFLVLVGLRWSPSMAHLGPPLLLYVLVRGAGKLLGGAAGVRLLRPAGGALKSGVGWGLLAQSGMPIAMVASYQRLYGTPDTEWVVSCVLISVVLYELAGPLALGRLLRREGEL